MKIEKQRFPIQYSMFVLLLILFVTNLRAPITSVGVLVGDIQETFYLSNILAGSLTTLPLIAFAIFSPFVPKLATKYGMEKIMFTAIIMLLIGHLIRPFSTVQWLFIGTACIGMAIAIGNVLAPAFVKKYFPNHIGLLTGFYTVSMNLTGALAAGLSIPIAIYVGGNWRFALSIWGVLSIVAFISWLPFIIKRYRKKHIPNKMERVEWKALLRSRVAWHITIFMGIQSMLFYCFVAWLPVILQEQGIALTQSGWMLSLVQFAQLPIVFIVPILADKMKDQRILVWITFCMIIIGLVGIFYIGNTYTSLFVVLFGMGAGVAFALSMMFFNLRSKSVEQAAAISGMAQSIGYLLAASGPLLLGLLYDMTSRWDISAIFLIISTIFLLVTGIGAAKERYV